LRIAGACGIASAVVAVCLETLAIYYSPVTFSFTQNWLIDLGGMSYTAFFNVARPEVSSPTTILLCLSGLIVAGILAIIFTWMLVRHKMVPRVISVVGLVGYALTLFGGLAVWFGLIDPAAALGTVINVPVAVFEIILLPFWLFFRGFKMPEATETEVSE
jgi:hypothetical protein